MDHKKDYSWLNCIATALLAYFFTVPFHEFLHFLTYYAYGDKVAVYSAGAVQGVGLVEISRLPTFHKIMLAGGSASVINAIIGILLFFVLLKARNMKPTLRLFLTQLMGGQLAQGIGYFMIGGLFGAGDWGNVFSYLQDSPKTVQVLRIVLSVVGCAGVVAIFFLLNYLSYFFIENKDNKKERGIVAGKLHLSMLVFGVLVGMICSALSPMKATGELDMGKAILFNFMWIPFFWAFMFTWVMVKPPKQSRFVAALPARPNYLLWVVSLVLILIDIFVFGPGVVINQV